MAKMLADKSTGRHNFNEGLVKSIADGNPASILRGILPSRIGAFM